MIVCGPSILNVKDIKCTMIKSFIKDAIESQDQLLVKEAIPQIDSLLLTTSDLSEKAYLLLSKSSCFAILGEFTFARECLESALQQDPGSVNTRLEVEFLRALLFQRESNYIAALEAFTSILSLYSDRLCDSELRFMYEDIQQRRAFLLVTLQQCSSAIPILKEVLSYSLEQDVRSHALVKLGYCYVESGEWILARASFLQAEALGLNKDQEGRFHFCMGMASFYTGAFDDARKQFEMCEERAAEYGVPLLDVYAWLSSVSERLGRVDDARRYRQLAQAT